MQKENQNTEWKESWRDEYIKWICGFANAQGGTLYIGINDERYITGAYVKIGFFANPADILYQDEVHGTLMQQVDKTMDLLLSKYMSAMISYEGIYRVETYPYPEKALREAVLNAIAHKDYSSGSPIKIKVFPSALYIWNDGELPHNWTLERFVSTHTSKPRNPDISNTFFRAGMVESWGRGISNILKECTLAGIPEPYFDLEMGGVDVRFSAKAIQNVSEESTVKSTVKTLELIKENPTITIPELATALNKSKSAIEKQIAKLKENQQLERIGPDKGGYWQIKN